MNFIFIFCLFFITHKKMSHLDVLNTPIRVRGKIRKPITKEEKRYDYHKDEVKRGRKGAKMVRKMLKHGRQGTQQLDDYELFGIANIKKHAPRNNYVDSEDPEVIKKQEDIKQVDAFMQRNPVVKDLDWSSDFTRYNLPTSNFIFLFISFFHSLLILTNVGFRTISCKKKQKKTKKTTQKQR